MAKYFEVRWHGRGGQGTVTGAKTLAEAVQGTGKYVTAFPEFGPERRGAPVRAFNRFSDGAVRIHSPVRSPDLVIVMDATLIGNPQIVEGVRDAFRPPRQHREERRRDQVGARARRESACSPSPRTRSPGSSSEGRSPIPPCWEPSPGPARRSFPSNACSPRPGASSSSLLGKAWARRRTSRPSGAASPKETGHEGRRKRSKRGASWRPEASSSRRATPRDTRRGPGGPGGRSGTRTHCTHCLTCWVFCPEGAFELVERPAPGGRTRRAIGGIDYFHCKGCGLCVRECPVNRKGAARPLVMEKEEN